MALARAASAPLVCSRQAQLAQLSRPRLGRVSSQLSCTPAHPNLSEPQSTSMLTLCCAGWADSEAWQERLRPPRSISSKLASSRACTPTSRTRTSHSSSSAEGRAPCSTRSGKRAESSGQSWQACEVPVCARKLITAAPLSPVLVAQAGVSNRGADSTRKRLRTDAGRCSAQSVSADANPFVGRYPFFAGAHALHLSAALHWHCRLVPVPSTSQYSGLPSRTMLRNSVRSKTGGLYIFPPRRLRVRTS